MKFTEHPQRYENVFTSEGALLNCDLTLIENDIGLSMTEYADFMGNTLKSSLVGLFDIAVRFHWAQRRFYYRGYQRKRSGNNNYRVDNAFATFTRHYLGANHRILTESFYYTKIVSYIEEFFPEFDKHNPFKNPELYEFPFKKITPDFLTVVYQMPERMELLRIAEEKNLSYASFLDYVVNYAYCENDAHNNKRFDFVFTRWCPPYVRYNLSKRNKSNKKKR